MTPVIFIHVPCVIFKHFPMYLSTSKTDLFFLNRTIDSIVVLHFFLLYLDVWHCNIANRSTVVSWMNSFALK